MRRFTLREACRSLRSGMAQLHTFPPTTLAELYRKVNRGMLLAISKVTPELVWLTEHHQPTGIPIEIFGTWTLALGPLDYLTREERAEMDLHLTVLAKYPVPHTEYQYRPLDWIVEKLGVARHTIDWDLNPGYERHKWDGTPNPLIVALNAIANWDDVGIEAATGTQKSFTAACLTFWFLACFQNSIVDSFATKEDTLRLYMWKEISRLWPNFQALFPMATLTDLRIRMDGETDMWAAHGKSAAVRQGEESATKAQGSHAEHMLTIVEEMPGVESAIAKAITNTRSSRHNLQLGLGNPDNQQDPLHVYCLKPSTVHVIISAYDHPNVVTGTELVPGAASAYGIKRILEDNDNDTESGMYKSRVRGISPAESIDSLIKRAWVEAALERYAGNLKKAIRDNLPPSFGVDVADSPKGDRYCKVFGRGNVAVSLLEEPAVNANLIGSALFDEAVDLNVDPNHIGVDPVGVGAGTVNEMVRLGMNPRRLGGSLAPVSGAQRAPDGSSFDFAPDANLFDNLRSQMAWQLREDFRNGMIALAPAFRKYIGQIVIVWYKRDATGIHLAPKVKIIEKLGASPNLFDALMYWNWVRPRSQVLTNKEAGDDQHPGLDYKNKRKLPRRRPVDEDGSVGDLIADDLRPNRPLGHMEGFKQPRWQRPDEDGDDY